MPQPAPARRAERLEPERPPGESAGAVRVRALVVDPAERTIRETRLPTAPGDERNGYGRQLDEKAVEQLVGVKDLEAIDVGDGQVAIADEMRQGQGETGEWTFGEAEPIAGLGVIVAYDPQTDEYADVRLSLDEARAAVKWGTGDEQDADEMRAAIDEKLDALDAAGLKRVLAMLDEIQGAGTAGVVERASA